MTNEITIAQIERAINYWCARQAPGEDGALCGRARVLADAYGSMIYERATTIQASHLASEQLDALRIALDQRELPL